MNKKPSIILNSTLAKIEIFVLFSLRIGLFVSDGILSIWKNIIEKYLQFLNLLSLVLQHLAGGILLRCTDFTVGKDLGPMRSPLLYRKRIWLDQCHSWKCTGGRFLCVCKRSASRQLLYLGIYFWFVVSCRMTAWERIQDLAFSLGAPLDQEIAWWCVTLWASPSVEQARSSYYNESSDFDKKDCKAFLSTFSSILTQARIATHYTEWKL